MAARALAASDLVWAFQILAAAQFFMTGLDKVSDAPVMVQLFAAVGFGQWFRYATGLIEILGSVLLLVPRVAPIGAALLGATLIGALIAHFTVLPYSPAKKTKAPRPERSKGAGRTDTHGKGAKTTAPRKAGGS